MTDLRPTRLPSGSGLTLLQKGLLLAAVPFLFQLGFIGLITWIRGESRDAEKWFVHSKEVIAQTHAAYASLVDAQSAARGLAATGDASFHKDFREAADEVPGKMNTLIQLVNDNPRQRVLAQSVADKSAALLEWLKKDASQPRDEKPADKGVGSEDGRVRMKAIRDELDEFLAEEERLDTERHQALEVGWQGLDWTIVAGTAASAIGIGVLAFGFGRGITRRFAVLADNAARLGAGQELAAPLAGGDEIAQVDRVFHRMADSLVEAGRKEKDYRDTLEQQATELRLANRELQEFASVASHDLQEPLRKIQAFGDRLRIRSAEALDDSGRDYLERMQNAAGRMQTLINDLLDFSRVTTRAQPFTAVDLRSVAGEVVSDLEGRLQQTGGRVEIGELPTLDADATQMRQLLQNLIGNALKFHRPGVPPVVNVRGRLLDGNGKPECEVVVSDNGIGFEEKYLDRIFKVFQRLHGRGEYEGTGMGLAICRKIVERHRGHITARSAPGEGSAFQVTLPQHQTQENSEGDPES